MTNQEKTIAEGDKLSPLSNEKPDDRFQSFLIQHTDNIRKTILRLYDSAKLINKYGMKVGFVYPRYAVIDESIKRMCCLPYARNDGRQEPCGGITSKRKACPPYSPAVTETRKLLETATAFVILQFESISDTIGQKHIHNFTVQIERELLKNNYSVLQTYCCGPCRVCTEGCTTEENCLHPQLRRFALESCGFWVNALCARAAEYPVYGNSNWKITWVKNWGLSGQTPKDFKSMSGILIK